MSTLEIVILSLGLAMDAAAVSMAAAAAGFTTSPRPVFRLAFHFGLFQAVMPAIGWMLGTTVVDYISSWDHWIAFALLGLVGARMIYSGFDSTEERMSIDPTKGWVLITLSIATSIDALAVGLSFSMLNMNILIPCLLIGTITILMSLIAVRVGTFAGQLTGRRVEIFGGFILIGIGLRILYVHLI